MVLIKSNCKPLSSPSKARGESSRAREAFLVELRTLAPKGMRVYIGSQASKPSPYL